MYDVRAKKHLGQHFLKDDNIARKIAGSLSGDVTRVLEVGPGTGVLTKFLLETGYTDLKVVEVDRESVAYLEQNYPELKEALISGDFLKMDLRTLFSDKFAIIGNFPYNISSQIFFKAIENRELVTELVGMIQQEVAQRIVAGPGSKTYGILSVLLQAWFDIEYLFTVPPTVFVPPPKVTSAVIKFTRNKVDNLGCDTVLFHSVVKTAFNQRRKTLHNALKPLADYQGDYAGKRAEQLSVAQFIELTNQIESIKQTQ
ncbi:MAG: 16S rRNA (adenine(1518)-N(6)/adenine(1519)-N(6))-dimethyltransferase RsmA [Bacteroidetes bacterium]|nr:16S rRNA (adenine(1518)-N(6)/adenine(1519)-N(6))-dimethyltransferase RsmA [Bacteroidota bacterium]